MTQVTGSKLRAALYLRVSTDEQTVSPQKEELMRVARERDWEVVGVFADIISGKTSTRSRLDAMMDMVRKKQVDVVAVVKLDRLARSLAHFAQLMSLMEKHDVAFVATTQGIDTSNENPAGRLQMHVIAAVAEFERSLISERTRMAMQLAKKNGVKFGNASKVMVSRPDIVTRQWYAETEGFDVRKLAKMLGGVSLSTAWKWAKIIEGEVLTLQKKKGATPAQLYAHIKIPADCVRDSTPAQPDTGVHGAGAHGGSGGSGQQGEKAHPGWGHAGEAPANP